MQCGECGDEIDPDTDRHLLVREELVAPDLGLEGADGGVYCGECMEPRDADLAP